MIKVTVFTFLFATLVGCSTSVSPSVTAIAVPVVNTAMLQWDAPTMNQDGTMPVTTLSGYRIYYGITPNSMTQIVNIPASTPAYEISGFTKGIWYFGVTAVGADGTESPVSNVVSKNMVN